MYQVIFQTDKNFLSPEEISRHLHVSRRTVMRWIADGQLVALRIGNVTRIPVDAYQQFLSAHLIISESSHDAGAAKVKRRKRPKRKQKCKPKGVSQSASRDMSLPENNHFDTKDAATPLLLPPPSDQNDNLQP